MNPTYIIGLGGAGIEIGIALNKICVENNIQNIAYRFIDTDEHHFYFLQEKYHYILNRNEFSFIGNFSPMNYLSGYTKHKDNDFDSWFDKNVILNPGLLRSGTGGQRQIGRLACFHHYRQINEEIHNDLNTLSHTAGISINDIDVYIISSMCGGAGSGIYIDIAAIICNIWGSSEKIQAALILPQVYFNHNPFGEETENMKSNTWAFLKEIDFFINDNHTPRKLMAEYSCKKSVYDNSSHVDFAPFNKANLFCNTTSEGKIIESDAFFMAVAACLCKYIGIVPLTALHGEFDMVIYNFNPAWQNEIPDNDGFKRTYNARKFFTPHIVGKWNDSIDFTAQHEN